MYQVITSRMLKGLALLRSRKLDDASRFCKLGIGATSSIASRSILVSHRPIPIWTCDTGRSATSDVWCVLLGSALVTCCDTV